MTDPEKTPRESSSSDNFDGTPKSPPVDTTTGKDLENNPLNWPVWKKSWHVFTPALISFSATLGSSLISPAISFISHTFHTSSTVSILPLSTYVLALALGPLIAAPFSESLGRKPVYLLSVPMGCVFTLGCGFSQNIAILSILRFFAGMAFSPALAIGVGSIADCYTAEKRARPSAWYVMSPFLGPALGPVIGSFVTVRKSWRWTQWTLIFFSIFSFLPLPLTSETLHSRILTRRAKSLNQPLPASPFPSNAAKTKFLLTVTLFRTTHILCTEPIVAFLSLYVAFNFSILSSFIAAFPYVFTTVY
ncbi:hypothetical protein EAF00_009923 [Botryotinia globosa]|nr:hypothetical protein EAF00_009923 [Botryotinia globosa]